MYPGVLFPPGFHDFMVAGTNFKLNILSNRHGLRNVRNKSLVTVKNSKMPVRFLRKPTSNSFENRPNRTILVVTSRFLRNPNFGFLRKQTETNNSSSDLTVSKESKFRIKRKDFGFLRNRTGSLNSSRLLSFYSARSAVHDGYEGIFCR